MRCSGEQSMKDSSAWNSHRSVLMSRRQEHHSRFSMIEARPEEDLFFIGCRSSRVITHMVRKIVEYKPQGLTLLMAVVAVGLFCGSVPAQSLLEKRFRVESEAEVLMDLRASAPQTSWAEPGSEAA